MCDVTLNPLKSWVQKTPNEGVSGKAPSTSQHRTALQAPLPARSTCLPGNQQLFNCTVRFSFHNPMEFSVEDWIESDQLDLDCKM